MVECCLKWGPVNWFPKQIYRLVFVWSSFRTDCKSIFAREWKIYFIFLFQHKWRRAHGFQLNLRLRVWWCGRFLDISFCNIYLHIYIYKYIYIIYIYIYIYIYVYIFNIYICSDVLTNWAIRPWVQLVLRVNLVQILQLQRFSSSVATFFLNKWTWRCTVSLANQLRNRFCA